MSREGLRVVPEAVPDVEEGPAQPSGPAAAAETAPGDPVRPAGGDVPRAAVAAVPAVLRGPGRPSASGTFVQQTAIRLAGPRLTGSAAELGLVLAVGGVPSLLSAVGRDSRRPGQPARAADRHRDGLWCAGRPAVGTGRRRESVRRGDRRGQRGRRCRRDYSTLLPARAFISSLVMPDDLSSAVSLNGVVMNSARVVGPALAGVLILTIGTAPCFAVDGTAPVPGRDRRAGDATPRCGLTRGGGTRPAVPRGPAVRGPAASSCGCRWS